MKKKALILTALGLSFFAGMYFGDASGGFEVPTGEELLIANYDTGGLQMTEIIVSSNEYLICMEGQDLEEPDLHGYSCHVEKTTHPMLRGIK